MDNIARFDIGKCKIFAKRFNYRVTTIKLMIIALTVTTHYTHLHK